MLGCQEVVGKCASKLIIAYECHALTGQGERLHMRSVIALAYKQFDAAAGAAELRELPRAAMEAELEYGGFAVFQCPLKVRIWHLYLSTGTLCSPYPRFIL